MAGLYVTFGKAIPGRLDEVARRMRFSDEAECKYESEFSYVWLSHDDKARFSPAKDPQTGVHCVVGGRLCWSTLGWQKAERLPYQGGIASRLILERYLKQGPEAVTPYNGAATVLIWDPRAQTIHLWTDQFGYHPALLYSDDKNRPIVFTTFPDAILADPVLEVRPDYASMAEFLHAWRATPPNTYYSNLKHAGPANHMTLNVRSGTIFSGEYWRPFENSFYPKLNDAAESLATALRAALRERFAVAEKVGLFISGGADSRVMLYATDEPEKIYGINLYEQPTEESAIARALCTRGGAAYIGFGRDNDYYPRMQAKNVFWSGAMWSVKDNHFLGVEDVVRQIGADLVMTACTTDWVFKGYGLEKSYHRFMGKNLPIKRFINSRVDGFLPNYPSPAPRHFEAEVRTRMENWFRDTPRTLKTDRDRLLVEDRRIRPTCYASSVSGPIMYRTYPYDTFLADSRIADCYAHIPAKWKLNGDVWGHAAARVCASAADIVDSNYGWAVDSNTSAKLLAFAKGWIKRRIRRSNQHDHDDGHPPCYASWPDMGWYATHSTRLKDFWNQTSQEHRELMAQLWGADPWATPLDQWSARPNDLMRVLTLLQHWRLPCGVT